MRKLMTLSGPSLTGKSSLAQLLEKAGAKEVVSTTTRAPREGEENGKHYWFVSKEEFEKDLALDGFVEHTYFDGNYYGVSKKAVEKVFSEGVPALVVCEVEGVRSIKAYGDAQGWEVERVFVNNPEQVLFARFLQRFSDDGNATVERYARRLSNMVGKERKKWIEPALDGRDAYETVISEFTEKTERDVVELLCSKLGITPSKRLPKP